MASFFLTKLTQRTILRISGPDCYSYLQGLLCNDLRNLYEPDRTPTPKYATATPNIMSAFMLNPQGRAICDLLLYRTPLTRHECEFLPPGKATDPDELLIECDSRIASGLANTLYGYRVLRKIVLSREDGLSTWCLFPKYDDAISDITISTGSSLLNLDTTEVREVVGDSLTVVKDPRLRSLGLRILSRSDEFDVVKRSIESIIDAQIVNCSSKNYKLFRYMLGVGEGINDHPESDCLPLECNADFLNSVSFSKGCYLGQELTARIHYTGVVRKRLMPIMIDLESGTKELGQVPLIEGSEIVDEGSGRKIGLLRSVAKSRALALLRHDLINDSTQLLHSGTKAKISTYVPYWWDLK